MNRNIIFGFVAVVLFVLGGIAGALISNAMFAGSGEASETITAPTLDPNVIPTASYSQLQATNEALTASLDEAQSALATAVAGGGAVADDESAEVDEVFETVESSFSDEPTQETDEAERVLFRIAQEESEARFKIDETLAGNDIVVVGATNQVAGDVVIDFGNPSSSQIGAIRVNVRTLRTDNSFRDDAIRGRVLQSSRAEFEFSDFVATDLIGLPSAIAVGDTVTFQIVGDLTVRGETRSITFETTVNVIDENRLEGLAVTVFPYRDFNLSIPQPPNVSFIGDDVTLELEFVALRVDG
jgi:polyisoprenoid-binding protein YceI